jgi:hypothetical protein
MNFAATRAAGGLHPELPGWTEQLAIALAASGDDHDIRIDQSDRIAVAGDSPGRASVRWGKLLIVLAAASCLAAAGVLGTHRFLKAGSVSAPPPPRTSEGHPPETHPAIVRADRAATASLPAGPALRAPPRIAHAKSPRAVAAPAPSASSYVPPAPAPAASAATPPVEARLTTPVPETRPTTIDGWVLREIVNGTVVLEGPDGIWRARRGDTVPGVGQVVDIFTWGNRMIVATSKGLITTP